MTPLLHCQGAGQSQRFSSAKLLNCLCCSMMMMMMFAGARCRLLQTSHMRLAFSCLFSMSKRVTCHPSPLTHGVTCQSTYLHKTRSLPFFPSISGEDRCRALLPLVLVPMTTSTCRGACNQLYLCKKGSSDRKLRFSP